MTNLGDLGPTVAAMLNDAAFVKTELTKAIECGGDEFAVQYQPKCNLRSGRVVGLEALMRWNHPVHGAISPEVFIPAAEDLGVMSPLWERLLDLVVSDVADLGSRALPVAVNVSPSLLAESRVLDCLVPVLESYRVPPSCIDIEITEGVFIRDKASTVEAMTKIRAAGFKIALDDFGTGFSCLSYLVDLPLDVLKLDKSFVGSMLRDVKSQTVVESLVALAHRLGLQVVAEGVETVEQHRLLRDVGTDVGQGYYYARPMSYDVLHPWLLGQPIELHNTHPAAIRHVVTCNPTCPHR